MCSGYILGNKGVSTRLEKIKKEESLVPTVDLIEPKQAVPDEKKKKTPIIRSGIGVLYKRGLLGQQSGSGEKLG